MTPAEPLLSPQLLTQLERLEIVTRKIFRGRTKGERLGKRTGQSVEFADFRNYVPGDDVRFIDWNTYARLDRLFLKMFFEEEDLRVFTLIDASRSMDFGSPTKLRYAKQLAAALGFIGLARGDRVKVETLGQAPHRVSQAWRGRANLARVVSQLEAIAPEKEVPLAEGIKNFMLRNPGQGVLVVVSDLMDKQGYEAAFRYLLSRSMDVYIVHVLSVEELEPDLQGDLQLLDCEDGATVEVTASAPLLRRVSAHAGRILLRRQGILHPAGAALHSGQHRAAGRSALGRPARPAGVAAMNVSNMLGPWQWGLLAAAAIGIVSLYFLKLRRRPLETPSTYLWRKSIEDLRINSIWQRLRRSLLLLLQLLVVACLALAALRVGWNGSRLAGQRFVFLIDNSGSMAATDVAPSRLAEAKRKARELIEQMKSGEEAMLISFNDSAQVEQSFTDNHRALRERLDAIPQTARPTSLAEALRLATAFASAGDASATGSSPTAGVAGPADAKPKTDSAPATSGKQPRGAAATLYVVSDGNFPSLANASLGSLAPVLVPIGAKDATNLAIAAFSAKRPDSQLSRLQTFGRLENFGSRDVTAEVELHRDGSLVDAARVAIKAGESAVVNFDLADVAEAVLELVVAPGGQLAIDDRAWTIARPKRSAQALLVTPGDKPLEQALASAGEAIDLRIVKPEFLDTEDYRSAAEAGRYDFVVYELCHPEKSPNASTLYIGDVPPGGGWSLGERVAAPEIIDLNAAAPIMRYVDMGDVIFAAARPITPPPGAATLMESNEGILFAVAQRDLWRDAVLGAPLMDVGADGQLERNTDWPLRLSFVVMLRSALDFLGARPEAGGEQGVSPGQSVSLEGASEAVDVRSPSGKVTHVRRDRQNQLRFPGGEELGVYEVLEKDSTTSRFAVNLFNSAESDIRPRIRPLRLGASEAPVEGREEGARRETWRPLLLLALGFLILEWYIYNRRVYV